MFTEKVLDHGFVTLRNLSGPTRRLDTTFDADDTDVANSARMSFDQTDSSRSYEVEMKLNRYLAVNRHMTPFESIEVWAEYKLPIFVARQFIRHRTFSFNEVSGRYVTLPAEWYIPDVVGAAPKDKKQGQSDGLPELKQRQFKEGLQEHCENGYRDYLTAIQEGVAPEHARMYLQLNHYTHWLMKGNLRNVFHFLALRDHAHAQVEAQAYAQAMVRLLEPHLPGLVGLYQETMR